MKLEKRVCGLELAKKLKELGVNQDSEYYWYDVIPDRFEKENAQLGIGEWVLENKTEYPYYSSFTVAEVGEMLPYMIRHNKLNYYLWIAKMRQWEISYVEGSHENIKDLINTYADTEADARAKMLIYLIKNKLIKVDEL